MTSEKQLLLSYQPDKGHKAISKQICYSTFSSEKDRLQVERLQDGYQSSQDWASKQIQPKVRPLNAIDRPL